MRLLNAIRAQLNSAHPDHHAIARGMAWVALFVLIGGAARAAREIVIAYRYGVSEEVDAYLFVFNVISWPVGVWLSVLTVVLVPLTARIRYSASGELPRFRSELLGLALLLGLTLALLAWWTLPLLLHAAWTGLSRSAADIATNMVPMLTLLAPLGVLISLFSASMMSDGRHSNTLLESVPALVLLVALLSFPGAGVGPLVWGTVAGFVFHLVSLVIPLAHRDQMQAPRLTHQSPHWPSFWQGFGIMLVGQALMSVTGIVDQFFAAHLGTGAIATLGYANRILALMLGMGAVAVSRATLPVFSRSQLKGGAQLHQIATGWVVLLFVLGTVAMIAGFWLAPFGVKVLFERGAFTAKDTAAVTEVLRYGLAQLPFYFAGLVLVSLLVSKGKYRVVTAVSSINFVVKVAGNFLFVKWFGMNGILLATSFMYMISMALCWIAVRRTL